jgi:YVTN family beta-propeller protein
MLAALAILASDLYFEAPAGDAFAQINPGGVTVLPNGRFLTPTGTRRYTGSNLFHSALSPDGQTVVGFADDELSVYRGQEPRRAIALKDVAPAGDFAPDGRSLLVSLGDKGSVAVLDAATFAVQKEITLNEGGFRDSYAVDLVHAQEPGVAFALDVANQLVITLDLVEGKVRHRTKGGRQPYALALAADGKKLHVANIGIFDYSVVPGPRSGTSPTPGIKKPPFGFPSPEAERGVEQEDRFIPGLGSPYVPDAQSVYAYRLETDGKPVLEGQAKSGLLIHAPADGGKAVGGSSPNFLLRHGKRLFVSNANNDSISVFDAETLRPEKTFRLRIGRGLERYRGIIPTGMAISPDGRRLYVCEGGINSVAVLDTGNGRVLGRIPTGWFPLRVHLRDQGRELVITTQKGLGRGPRGPRNPRSPQDERFGFPDMPGMLQTLPVPSDAELKKGEAIVARNNGFVPMRRSPDQSVMPIRPGKASEQIQYVVFITKENHTFDGIFGGLKGAKGDPEYAEFGMEGWINEKGRAERMPIMPNHIRLAEQFGISENFYMEPHASGDGHRWLVGVYPSLWTTRVFYAGWNFRPNNDAKGRLMSIGSDGSQIPEDYLENGSMWEHLDRHGITFRNYGEGYEMPGSIELPPNSRTGTNYLVNHPMPKILFDNTDFNFPAYNTHIPDIARADWFIEDIEKNFRAKSKPLPRFINIAICNDHGDAPRPEQGYPYVCSYMADNDVALGRIVQYLSRQPEWRNMAIFVTQDDPGADNDHIDRHRSFVLAISPYAKRGYISRRHTSIMSIIRSIYLMFGIGPNNLFDAVATPLDDMFTDKPDFTPYVAVEADRRVFRPEETFDPEDPEFKKRRTVRGAKMDDPKYFDWLRNRMGQN